MISRENIYTVMVSHTQQGAVYFRIGKSFWIFRTDKTVTKISFSYLAIFTHKTYRWIIIVKLDESSLVE